MNQRFVYVWTLVVLLGCPQDLNTYDEACERDEYVTDGRCESCYDPDRSVQGTNEPGDWRYDGDTQCDYDIEKDIVGNYTSGGSTFTADFDGNVSYFDADYTVLKTDHDAHYLHLQKAGEYFSLNWRKKDRILCLSKMWGPFDSEAALPGGDYVTYDETADCEAQAGADWTHYNQENMFGRDQVVLRVGSQDINIEGMQWVSDSPYTIVYAVDKHVLGHEDLTSWKSFVLYWENSAGSYSYHRWD